MFMVAVSTLTPSNILYVEKHGTCLKEKKGNKVYISKIIWWQYYEGNVIGKNEENFFIFNEKNKDVKKSMSWMLREMTKNYKNELVAFVKKWQNADNKHTKWIIKHGIKKLPKEEQQKIFYLDF